MPTIDKDIVTVVDKEFKTPYKLHYKAVHNVSEMAFLGPESKEEAIELGKIYCNDRKWRFIQVRPLFNNILDKPQSEEERAQYK